MLSTTIEIFAWSVACYLMAYGWINKLTSENGLLFFVQDFYVYVCGTENKTYRLLFGCEPCLSGQLMLWTSLFYCHWSIATSILASLVAIGIAAILNNLLFKE